jgi:hypothetical protein
MNTSFTSLSFMLLNTKGFVFRIGHDSRRLVSLLGRDPASQSLQDLSTHWPEYKLNESCGLGPDPNLTLEARDIAAAFDPETEQ